MKKINIKFLIILAAMPLLASCTNIISNPDVQTLNNKAVELMNSGDVKGAISRLESINDINPNFAQTNYNLGVAYYKNGEYEKSIESLKKSVSLDKNITDAYYTLGYVYQDLAEQQIDKLEKPNKPDKKESVNSQDSKQEKQLSKKEALTQIVDNLQNSKNYFTLYMDLIKNQKPESASQENPEAREAINNTIQSLDNDIKKYQEKISK